jgi:hypothetical protein
MNRDNTREQNLLDHYWDADAANRQYIPDELEPSLRETVDQFHAEDDAPEPDQEFVDRLWSDLAGDTTVPASTTSPPWTADPNNDEPTEPQFVSGRQEDPLQTKQQSIWRRRARQIGELVAGVLVLALVTGGLILAYQNLLGTGGDDIPGAGDDDATLVPSVETISEVQVGSQYASAGVIEIDDEDYIVLLESLEIDGEPDGTQLRVVQSDEVGELEEVGSLVAPVPWDSYMMQMGGSHVTEANGVLYIPLLATDQNGEQPILWVVDLNNPVAPEEHTYIQTGEIGAAFAVSDSLLAMTGHFGGEVVLYDITEPGSPELSGSYSPADGDIDALQTRSVLAIDDTFLYALRENGLEIIDISDPSQPEPVSFYENPEWDGSPDARDITPVTPEGITEQVLSPGDYSDFVVHEGYAYVSAGHQEILILDVSDPSEPQEVDRFDREDHTFRLARTNDFIYVLGAEAVEEEDNARLLLSLEFIEIASPGELRQIDRVDDFAAEFETAGSALMIQHFAQGGDSLLAYGNFPSAYVAHIDWVEPTDDAAAAEMPTPAPDEPSSNLPDQDPREVVIELVDALGDDDWDRVRDLSIPPLQNFNDSAIRSTTVGDLPNMVLARMMPLDSVDHWTVEHHEDWSVVRHIDRPSVAFVFVEDGGEWRLDPGFHNVSRAQIISDVGPEGLREYAQPVALGKWEGDPDPIQISSSIEGSIAAVRVSESGLDVAVQLRFHPAEEAILSVDNIRWTADGVEGRVNILQTNALKTDSLVDFPLTPGDGGIYWMILRASDVPEEANSLIFMLNEIQINGLERTDVDADDMVINGAFDVPNQTAPDLSDISSADSSAANLPAHFPRQSEDIDEYDSGAPQGTLAMDEQGCLRFGDEDGPVIIWPHSGFYADVIDGEIALIDEETGDVIAFVGDEVSFHGSDPAFAPDSVPDHMLDNPIPEACTDVGGYFITGPGIGTP